MAEENSWSNCDLLTCPALSPVLTIRVLTNRFATMGSEGKYAIITNEEEIKKLFPTPLLGFGALEMNSQSLSKSNQNRKHAKITGTPLSEGGVRSRDRRSDLPNKLQASTLLPDSLEYISSLEKMVDRTRAKQFSRKDQSDFEMSSIESAAAPALFTPDDERIPFIMKVENTLSS
jgi:hypothetical protein